MVLRVKTSNNKFFMRTLLSKVVVAIALVVLGLPLASFAQSNVVDVPLFESILSGVIERSKKEAENERAFKQQYSFTRKKVTEYRDGDGDLKSRKEKSTEKKPIVVTETGTPVIVSASSSKKGAEKLEKGSLVLTKDVISRFQFTLVGSETVNDRPAWVVDFKPRSGKLPEKELRDRFINRAAGRIWLDQADCALVKADIHLTDKVKVVGGIVGVVKRFTCLLERGRTEEGIWFLSNLKWRVEGRQVFSQKIVDCHEQWLNVRKVQ